MSVARVPQPQSVVSRPQAPSAPATPKTPAAQVQHTAQATPNGSWKHPQFDEIARRQYANTFDESNVKAIVYNAGLLLLSVTSQNIASSVPLVNYIV